MLARRVMKTLFVNYQYEVEKEKEKKGNENENKKRNSDEGKGDKVVGNIEKEVTLSAVKKAENIMRRTAIDAVRYILQKNNNDIKNGINTIECRNENENENKNENEKGVHPLYNSTKSSLQLINSFLCYLPYTVLTEIYGCNSDQIPTDLGLLCADFKTDFDVINGCIIFAFNHATNDIITKVELEVEVEVGSEHSVEKKEEKEVQNGLISDTDVTDNSAMLLALVLNKVTIRRHVFLVISLLY